MDIATAYQEMYHTDKRPNFGTLFKETTMASANMVQVELTPLDRAWLKKSLQSQRMMIQRSLVKEVVGSEVHVIRVKEIAMLDVLINRFT